ncbi:hypothetical protein [Methylophaga sp.]|uniref:hypothetical protein n=1 Tax=Methylophaga sp. TaxID=2024840 RepID=UPI0027201AA8|nr:hypothetical protein [Methylophaga sp.]MDO8826804.1 hypothetical protein [Methylophaga sp.]
MSVDVDLRMEKIDEIFKEHFRNITKKRKKLARERKKKGLPNPDNLFVMPPEHLRNEMLDEEKDSRVLYGKIPEGEDSNPGIKLSKYLDDLTLVEASVTKATLVKYSDMGTIELMEKINSVSPLTYNKRNRLEFYICNILLSKRGIAPRWRKMQPTGPMIDSDWLESITNFNRDVQVFDFEWIRRKYPEHKTTTRFNKLFRHVMKSQEFDYSHAYRVAASSITAEKKAKYMGVTYEMELETVVIKSKAVKSKLLTKERHVDEVRTDLLNAARKNPHRGGKLLAVIEQRLELWLSAVITETNSASTMAATYKAMTGKNITVSNYMKRLKATNAALNEVGSKFVLKFV